MSRTIVHSANLWSLNNVYCSGMDKRQPPAETFVINLKALMKTFDLNPNDIERMSIAKGRKVTSRHVRHILNGERKPSVEAADDIANVFGLSGWQMLIPTLLETPSDYARIESLLDDWSHSDNEGREYIEITAKRESGRKKVSNGDYHDD